MIRYRRRFWVLAAALSAIAGFVDAIAFLQLGGFFVSFMSGNSTRLGVGLATDAHAAALAGGLIATFVAGVMLGAFANRDANKSGAVRVLILVAATLALAGVSAGMGAPALAVAALALAMGAENAVFQRDGEVSIGVTYMTGALVRFGQKLAAALTGGALFDWAPFLLLWAGLVAGAALGALAFGTYGVSGVWFAAGAVVVLALIMWRMPHGD
ncbi:MAG: DUF1275 family protein [Hyphomonadaceae bacterium]